MRTVYLNGQFVPESEAKLSIYDLSVMQAAAAFEMTRSFDGVQFKLREHLMRLMDSCELLSIPLEENIQELEHLCDLTAGQNDHGPGEEHRLLIVVSPGCAPMYKDLAGVIPHPFVYIADFPLRYTVAGFSKYFTEGVHGVTSKVQQVPDACIPSQAKHRSRLHFHLAQQQAPAGTWPLLLTVPVLTPESEPISYFAEAPGANICIVVDGQVHTIEDECLGGISLATVKELVPTESLLLQRHTYHFQGMTELWLTGTPFCMLPVVSLDGKPIGDGKPGPVFKDTLRKWCELVGVNIQQQIEAWDAVTVS